MPFRDGTIAVLSVALLATAVPDVPGDGPAPGCATAELAAVADSVTARFDRHRFVFIGSTHGGVKRHRFLLCLLARPRFQNAVTDLVVEFVSGAHQALLDRYLLALEEVPVDSLRLLALDTDYPQLFATLPQVPEFLQAVRAVNAGRASSRRLRVLGGSETVRWSRVRAPADLAPYPFKTNWTAHLLTAHLARDPGTRTLVVYGDGHIRHGGTLTGDVEAVLDADSLYVVGTIATLGEGMRDRVAGLGDPARPLFSEAGADAAGRGLDAFVYLGPSADTNLMGTLPLSAAEQRELARRERLGGREAMNVRFGGRARWFAEHPRDLPADPRGR